MRRQHAYVLLSIALLCGCVLAPGSSHEAIDMEQWCSRDVRKPWTGCWVEVARLGCETGQEHVPEQPIEEFRLTSPGVYSVTWSPFEFFVDYSGRYEVNAEKGAIELLASERVPPDFQGRGTFSLTDQGELSLQGVWLGAREAESVDQGCGHRFRLKTAR